MTGRPVLRHADRPAGGFPDDGRAISTRAPQALVALDRARRVLEASDGVERVLGRSSRELAGRRIDHVPRLGGRGHLESLWPDGTLHVLEYAAAPPHGAAPQLVAFRDVTGEAPETSTPAARDLKLAAAAELRGGDADALLQRVAPRICAALGTDLAAVFEYRGGRRRLLLRAGCGWAAGAVGRATVSAVPRSPVGSALAAGEPVIIRDLRAAPFTAGPSRLLHEHAVISGVAAPIDGPTGLWGVLGVYERRLREFLPDDVDFLSVVANALGLALERERLEARLETALDDAEQARRERHRAVTEAVGSAERRARMEITQLLHDEALQSLLAARQHLVFAAAHRDRTDAVVHARDSVHRAIRELRGAVAGLHPVALEEPRLREAIEAVVQEEARRGGFRATVDLAVPSAYDCAPLLLAVIRELTRNAADHAGARALDVVLGSEGADLVLEVRDDGVGVAPGRLDAALADGHIGLASTARRVQAFGGSLAVRSRPGGGTVVRVVIAGRVAAGAEAETVHFTYSSGDSL
ncbi:MAG TPA: GAF domain-containing protein [Solirubrobacter sp.]|nr:GAF domain-containing protein [Solirubrobacter sp.]